jgi:hypothetical protein
VYLVSDRRIQDRGHDDVILGPLLTLVVANPAKPRRELARDIGSIIGVQILAAGYGA